MKLYLAVAVLLLALATRSEAQGVEEPTTDILEQLNQFGEKVAELGQDIAMRTKATFENTQDSEFATQSRAWFVTQYQLFKAKLADLGQ